MANYSGLGTYTQDRLTKFNDQCVNDKTKVKYINSIDVDTRRQCATFILHYTNPKNPNTEQYVVLGSLQYRSGKEFSGNGGNVADFNRTIERIQKQMQAVVELRSSQPDIGVVHYNKTQQLRETMDANNNVPFGSNLKITREFYENFVHSIPQENITRTIEKTVFVDETDAIGIYDRPIRESGRRISVQDERYFRKMDEWEEKVNDNRSENNSKDETLLDNKEDEKKIAIKNIGDLIINSQKNHEPVSGVIIEFGRNNASQVAELAKEFISEASMQLTQFIEMLNDDAKKDLLSVIATACAQHLYNERKKDIHQEPDEK